MTIIHKTLYWLGWFFAFVVLFMLGGGLIGGTVFVTVGWLSHPELNWTYRWGQGFLHGVMYFGIWSGGMGIVLCFIKGYNLNREKEAEYEEP